jgi:hypothetical protein
MYFGWGVNPNQECPWGNFPGASEIRNSLMNVKRINYIRHRRWANTLCCALLVLICAGLVVLCGPASGGLRSGNSGENRMPLWRMLPTRAFATLGVGRGPASQWAAYTYRSPSSVMRPGIKPCIVVLGVTRESTFLHNGVCGQVQPSVSAPEEPPSYALMSASVESRGQSSAESVFAAGLPSVVERVAVRFEDAYGHRFTREASTKMLSEAQGRKARLVPFRYVVISVRSNVCVDSMIGYGVGGGALFDLREGECPLIRPRLGQG